MSYNKLLTKAAIIVTSIFNLKIWFCLVKRAVYIGSIMGGGEIMGCYIQEHPYCRMCNMLLLPYAWFILTLAWTYFGKLEHWTIQNAGCKKPKVLYYVCRVKYKWSGVFHDLELRGVFPIFLMKIKGKPKVGWTNSNGGLC
jgi:hypothetical protein